MSETEYIEFLEEYDSWEEGEPTDKFKESFVRYIESVEDTELPDALDIRMIRNRAESYEKNEDGLTFKMERHPGAFTDNMVGEVQVREYSFDLVTAEVKVMDPFRFNDPYLEAAYRASREEGLGWSHSLEAFMEPAYSSHVMEGSDFETKFAVLRNKNGVNAIYAVSRGEGDNYFAACIWPDYGKAEWREIAM